MVYLPGGPIELPVPMFFVSKATNSFPTLLADIFWHCPNSLKEVASTKSSKNEENWAWPKWREVDEKGGIGADEKLAKGKVRWTKGKPSNHPKFGPIPVEAIGTLDLASDSYLNLEWNIWYKIWKIVKLWNLHNIGASKFLNLNF